MNITLGNTITWDADASADSYDVRLEQLSGALLKQINVASNFAPADDLLLDAGVPVVTVNTAYVLKVRAINELGPSAWTTVSVTVAAPAPPANIQVI